MLQSNYQKKFFYGILILFLVGCMLLGCGKKKETGTAYQVYYVNKEETGIFSNEMVIDSTEQNQIVYELLTHLQTTAVKLDYKAPISDPVELLNYSIAEKQLILNFSESYRKQETTTEVLARAAIVRTLTQVPGISYVSFVIKEEPLKDNSGTIVGPMSADMFIDNAGKEINSYEKVRLRLYLANSTGDGLVQINRSVVYKSNVSLEKLVVEQLIAGVKENEQGYPTINPETKIVSVTVKDGTCYVNLDENFLTQPYQVSAEVTVYSITNSLVELSNINKVQISINGDNNVMYHETTNLNSTFERNLELVRS